jgi:endonuclease/exonuclease/phosphatase family metal-dependent hydrolase
VRELGIVRKDVPLRLTLSSLTLFSLNTFGTPVLFGMRRMNKLVGSLNQMVPDLLCMQEIQSNAYLPILQRALPDFPYQVYQKRASKPLGGLLTASRLPLSQWEFHPFPNRGRKWSLGYADWALQKGVLVVRFEIEGQSVVCMNTHLQANYLSGWSPDQSLAQIQRDQVGFLAMLVRNEAENALVIVCGDFNFPPHTFLYSELIEHSGLIDPLANDPRPTYKPFPLVSSSWSIRLDYTLYRAPDEVDVRASADVIRLQDEMSRLPWERFLTDHYLLKLVLHWQR